MKIHCTCVEGDTRTIHLVFQVRDTILLQLIYDGTKIGMLVDYNDPGRPGIQAVQEFEGQINPKVNFGV